MKDCNFTSKRGFLWKEIVLCTEKSVFIVKKHRFYNERLKFYIETRFSIKENSIRYRKSVCIVKKTRFLQ